MKKVKKQEIQNCVTKTKFKYEDYKNCLKASQVENKIIHLEKESQHGKSKERS